MSERLLETDFPSNEYELERRGSVKMRKNSSEERQASRYQYAQYAQPHPHRAHHQRPLSTSGPSGDRDRGHAAHGVSTMPKHSTTSAASEWQYEPSLSTRTASMSRVQTSFAGGTPVASVASQTKLPVPAEPTSPPYRTGSLKRALTSDEEEEYEDERRQLQAPLVQPHHRGYQPQVVSVATQSPKRIKNKQGNNSNSSTSDYHSDENHHNQQQLLPTEHRDLPSFRLQNFNNASQSHPRSVRKSFHLVFVLN